MYEALGRIMLWILETLVQEIVVVIAGVLFARLILQWWDERRYGGWQVLLKRKGETILQRHISAGKVKEILAEPSELDDFLKGVVSPYAWIHCDIIEEGEKLGLLEIDRDARRFTINLDKNPPKAPRAQDQSDQLDQSD